VYEPALHSQQTIANVDGPFGWGGGRWGKDYVCAWYCNRPPGLIIGVYAFPADQLNKLAQQRALDEAAHIVASAVFNRPSWGGRDEPLTRHLLNQLEADWHEHILDAGSDEGGHRRRGAARENQLH
jgi:hypothetical protein